MRTKELQFYVYERFSFENMVLCAAFMELEEAEKYIKNKNREYIIIDKDGFDILV